MPALQPLCFVLMPFGKKKDPSRPRKPEIDFNAIYTDAIQPAIQDAGMKAIRADQEETLGIIHKPMFERLLLSDFAVADLTIPNPNVLYELGVRHASRHNSTLPIFADHVKLPFDVALLRGLPFAIGKKNEFEAAHAKALRESLGKRLKILRELARTSDAADSPVFQLVQKSQQSNLSGDERLKRIRDTDGSLYELLNRYSGHEKTDIFREMVEYSGSRKRQLAAARRMERAEALAALNQIRREIEPLDGVEAGVIVDLYLSYRAISAWDEMIELFHSLPEILRRTVLVREQFALALNRRAPRKPEHPEYRDEALEVLNTVIKQLGPNSETCGLTGRIFKDLWQEALRSGDKAKAEGHLKRAIEAYASGFAADWRDAYPGVNAVTLLDIEGSEESEKRKRTLLPLVRFAVAQRIATSQPDYWDYATLLELEVIAGNEEEARRRLPEALAHVREHWEPETTAANLGYILDARTARGGEWNWVAEIIHALKPTK